MQASRSRRWGMAAGLLGLLLIAVVSCMGPPTDEDLRAYRPPIPLAAAPLDGDPAPITAQDAVVTGGPRPTSPSTLRWREAFQRNWTMNLRHRVHQARVTGTLEDIVAAHRMASRCEWMLHQIGRAESGSEWPPEMLSKLTDRQLAQVPAYRARCEGASEAKRAEFRLLHAGPDAQMADALIRWARGNSLGLKGQQLVQYAQDQGSPVLMAEIASEWGATNMEWLGWKSSALLARDADRELVRAALRLTACLELGNCEQMAQEDYACREWLGCVDDQRLWIDRFVLSPPGQRVWFLKPWSQVEFAVGMEFWERKLLAMGVSPSDIREFRQTFVPDCRTTECLQQRWAEIQAFVAALISGAHKPGQPWPP